MDLISSENNSNNFNETQLFSENFKSLLEEQADLLSPQITRRVIQLISSLSNPIDEKVILSRLLSLFQRLLLELVQAQYSTKHREQDFLRLMKSKGCSVEDPDLFNHTIELLVKLYQASVKYGDTSLKRTTIIGYIMRELGPNHKNKKRNVERVIQTVYRCSCFHVMQRENSESLFELKDNLYNANELRYQIDVELINIAKVNLIRLPPDSWAYLLHGRSTPENISQMQSILDKHVSPVEVSELQDAILKSGDKLSIRGFLQDMHDIQALLAEFEDLLSSKVNRPTDDHCIDHEDHDCIKRIVEIMERLLDLKRLFSLRQQRSGMVQRSS